MLLSSTRLSPWCRDGFSDTDWWAGTGFAISKLPRKQNEKWLKLEIWPDPIPRIEIRRGAGGRTSRRRVMLLLDVRPPLLTFTPVHTLFHVCPDPDQTYQDSWRIHEMIKADNQSLGKKRKSQQIATQLKNPKGKQLGCYPLPMARVGRKRSMNQGMSLRRMNRCMIGSRRGTSCWVCACKGGCWSR